MCIGIFKDNKMRGICLSIKERLKQSSHTLSFLNWLAIGNTIFFSLLCIPYLNIILASQTLFEWKILSFYTIYEKILIPLGLITAYLGQCALLAYLPILLLLFPLTLLIKRHRMIASLAIITATLSVMVLLTDIVIFSTYHFHINLLFLPLLSKSDLSNTEWGFIAIIAFGIILIEILFGYVISRFLIRQPALNTASHIAGWSWPFLLITSYMIYISSVNTGLVKLAQQTPILPLYNQVFSFISYALPFNIDVDRTSETLFAQPKLPTSKLFYPKHTLVFNQNTKPYNIVMIVIDAWRFDALNEQLTPNLYAFAKQSWHFKNHVSGGNSTEAGLTSLLYGIPHLYWTSLKTAKQGAVLVDSLQKQGYQSKVFFSSFMIPRFDQTAFVSIPNLRTTAASGNTIPDKDRTITQEWYHFLKHRNKEKPFFTFSLYDAAHGYCSTQNIQTMYATNNQECSRFLQTDKNVRHIYHRYLNAVHFLDQQIGFILDKLAEEKILDHTVVLITGDHGEEFYDTELHYLGHSSNYSMFQTHTPLIVHWPKTKPTTWIHATSHYDITATLMKEVLACQNPFSDYNIGGKILWDTKTKKEYVLAGSYTNSAILENQRHIILKASGDIEITDLYGRSLPANTRIKQSILNQALNDFRWFYRQP